ncbi:MAG: glycoside hydrolase family protein [Ghiorsea sp.]
MNSLIEQLKRHEGFRGQPYKCSAGKTTIGYGRNLDANPMTEYEAEILLKHDVEQAENELYGHYPSYRLLDETRRNVLINMVFNLGISRFLKFKKMHKALLHGDFREAAYEMRNSKWAIQVGARAVELSGQMEYV